MEFYRACVHGNLMCSGIYFIHKHWCAVFVVYTYNNIQFIHTLRIICVPQTALQSISRHIWCHNNFCTVFTSISNTDIATKICYTDLFLYRIIIDRCLQGINERCNEDCAKHISRLQDGRGLTVGTTGQVYYSVLVNLPKV